MFIENGGHSTASGLDVMAGEGGGAGDGSVDVSTLVPRCSAGVGSGRCRRQPEQTNIDAGKGRCESRLFISGGGAEFQKGGECVTSIHQIK
jgi:hypothetical protein